MPMPMLSVDLSNFASEARPLRPSKIEKFLACPMSVVLSAWDEDSGGKAAQTGNLIHDAAEAYHNAKADRVAAGLTALAAARQAFPLGDAEKAERIFRLYAADPKNSEAVVLHNERQVILHLPCAKDDPTGKPVVIKGTLDQVRLEMVKGAMLKRVWDIKTGDRLTGEENLLEYAVQQAVYVLAARESLDPEIMPGGLIYTPGYERNRGSRHIPFRHGVAACWMIVQPLIHWAAAVRRGEAIFRPSPTNCEWCEHGPWPKCIQVSKTVCGLTLSGE